MTEAIVIEKYGSSEVLKYKNLDIGRPGEDELLIRNTAIGVNYHDVYVRSGLYKTLKLPGIPGCEAAGVVEKIGIAISDFKVGDRVVYITSEYGAYSSHIKINKEKVVKLPKTIGDELIATNFLRAMTVEMLLNRITVIDKTKTILVTAAAGGVGRLLCQWARIIPIYISVLSFYSDRYECYGHKYKHDCHTTHHKYNRNTAILIVYHSISILISALVLVF